MKLATFINAGRDEVGFTIDDGAHIVSLQEAYKAASLSGALRQTMRSTCP